MEEEKTPEAKITQGAWTQEAKERGWETPADALKSVIPPLDGGNAWEMADIYGCSLSLINEDILGTTPEDFLTLDEFIIAARELFNLDDNNINRLHVRLNEFSIRRENVRLQENLIHEEELKNLIELWDSQRLESIIGLIESKLSNKEFKGLKDSMPGVISLIRRNYLSSLQLMPSNLEELKERRNFRRIEGNLNQNKDKEKKPLSDKQYYEQIKLLIVEYTRAIRYLCYLSPREALSITAIEKSKPSNYLYLDSLVNSIPRLYQTIKLEDERYKQSKAGEYFPLSNANRKTEAVRRKVINDLEYGAPNNHSKKESWLRWTRFVTP
jgi:hypothetical protein